jgi:hypothetical protein
VITIGFEKPFILAKAILGASEPAVDPHRVQRARSTIPLSVRRKVLIGIDAVGHILIKHYAFEICVLSLGAATGTYIMSYVFELITRHPVVVGILLCGRPDFVL